MTTNRNRPLLLLVLCLLAALLGPALALADPGVSTRLIFLIGHTEPGSGDERMLLPGDAVLPLEEEVRHVTQNPSGQLDLAGVASSLENTLRLDRVQTRKWGTFALAPSTTKTFDLSNPGGLRARVTLTELSTSEAAYLVRIELGKEALVETTVRIPLGQRAVVGALDGPSAPYVFLVVEALEAVDDAAAAGAAEITPAEPLQEIKVAYTEKAAEVRIQGVVIVEAEIDATGKVVGVRVLKGLPMGLDQEAVRAVEATPFAPATDASGNPVASKLNLALDFRIDS